MLFENWNVCMYSPVNWFSSSLRFSSLLSEIIFRVEKLLPSLWCAGRALFSFPFVSFHFLLNISRFLKPQLNIFYPSHYYHLVKFVLYQPFRPLEYGEIWNLFKMRALIRQNKSIFFVYVFGIEMVALIKPKIQFDFLLIELKHFLFLFPFWKRIRNDRY